MGDGIFIPWYSVQEIAGVTRVLQSPRPLLCGVGQQEKEGFLGVWGVLLIRASYVPSLPVTVEKPTGR